MLVKKILAVDIGSKYIKLIYINNFVGGAKKIKASGIVEIPLGVVNFGNLVDTTRVSESIFKFIKERDIHPKEISFVIHGSDIAIRYLEVPILNNSSIKRSINWDISQYHANNFDNYILDFQIIETIKDKEKKAYRILTALVSKEKINRYIDISEKLGLKLKSIDLSSNCISRTINHLTGSKEEAQNLAVIDFGYQSTQFIILHKGMLFAERELNFGLENIINIISDAYSLNTDEAFIYLREKINISDNLDSDICKNNIVNILRTHLDVFSRLIKFYKSEKNPSKIDRIYISGGGCEISGFDKYIGKHLGLETQFIEENSSFARKMRYVNQADYKHFLNVFGLFTRKEI